MKNIQRIQRSIESIKRKDMSEMNGQRSDVMNDDILGLILKRLDLKDMFCLKLVSQQFRDCVKEVLQKKTEVSVGLEDQKTSQNISWFKPNFEANVWNRIDITSAVSLRGIDLALDDNRNSNIESTVSQFRGVKKLYLASTVISLKTMQLFVKQWPQLQEIYIYDIQIQRLSDQTITEWTQLLSNIKHLSIGCMRSKYIPFLRDLITQLRSLQSVNVRNFNSYYADPTIPLPVLADCLPPNIHSLRIDVSPAETQALDVITNRCTKLKTLCISETHLCISQTPVEGLDFWNLRLPLICDRLNSLKYLTLILDIVSAKDFAKNIAKLKHLKKLVIKMSGLAHFQYFGNRMNFDTREMARHMRPMVTLNTLSLSRVVCPPNGWSDFCKVFPNVRRLRIDYTYYRCDCPHEQHYCEHCFYRSMVSVSNLSQLKHVILSNVTPITRHVLDLFASVDHLSILSLQYSLAIEELIPFITETLANGGGVFRLDLFPDVRPDLIQRVAAMDAALPERICSYKSSGKHFGALTCKSCKPFFRRNALKNKVFKCKTNGKCVIDRNTRKSCRKCRLNKCLSVGMKKENIRNEEEKQLRRILVEENRRKRQNRGSSDDNMRTSTDEYKSYSNSDEEPDSQNSKNIINISLAVDSRRKQNSNKDFLNDLLVDSSISQEMINCEIKEIVDYIEDKAKADDERDSDSHAIDVYKTIEKPFVDCFIELQDSRLRELMAVTKVWDIPSVFANHMVQITNRQIMDYMSGIFYDKEVKNVITLSKSLSTFERICDNDRIALVKYGCMDILCLRSVTSYDTINEYWRIVLNEEISFLMRADILKSIRNDVYMIYIDYFTSICHELDSDPIILDLLTAIVLFNPDRQYLIHKEAVKQEQNLYIYLLQRYLRLKYKSECQAEFKFGRLCRTLKEIYLLGENQLKLAQQDDPAIYGPLWTYYLNSGDKSSDNAER
ncbi:unnamed protein product [Medioppia subpectinata]|uniref:Uncharacterized protein n=1 Tax=Medioppia subpectinata TaxID=1979941 RepID=A0A7R9PSU6_9ACAR|nr:unnamed protein product [Medioppia subpectinata]CAG2100003.1 unnamed protein product [Medioppia subpectinata]